MPVARLHGARQAVGEPHAVMQVDDVDARRAAAVGVLEVGLEADDPAVHRRAPVVDGELDRVLPRADVQRPEAVVQVLDAGGLRVGRGRGRQRREHGEERENDPLHPQIVSHAVHSASSAASCGTPGASTA
jgi:hypothetical protein